MIKELTEKIINKLSCKHEKKVLISSIPDYADPHCTIVGLNTTYKCLKCQKYIKEYTKY
jgi:hypothetical protein